MTAVLVVYAIAGVITGNLTPFDAIGLVFGAGTVSALRAGIGKIEGK